MRKKLFILLQYITPHHLLTWFVGKLANSEVHWIKNTFIRFIIKNYPIDLSEASDANINNYKNFNQFFTRHLKQGSRSIDKNPSVIVSPADGNIAAIGDIHHTSLLQAKQTYYSLQTLLGDDHELTKTFEDGHFICIYLAPHNYHRVHMPYTGTLEKSIFVPGKLFSVNKITTNLIPALYCRNERLISIFNTDIGKMAVILVGAMIVGSIKTVWSHEPMRSRVLTTHHTPNPLLEKGAEMGLFEMGSTVIVLFEKNKMLWDATLGADCCIQVGSKMGLTAHS